MKEIIVILLLTIVISTSMYLVIPSHNYLFADPNKHKKPTQSIIHNAVTYLNKYPQRRIPPTYKPLVNQGYVIKKGNTWKPSSTKRGRKTGGSGNKGSGNKGNGNMGSGNKGSGNMGSGSFSGIEKVPTGFTGVIKANSSRVCSNVGYAGGRLCSGNRASTSSFVEDDAVQNDSAKPTFAKAKEANPNGIRAGYLNLGSPSIGMKGLPTTKGHCPSYLAHQKGCIDWGNSSVAERAVQAAKIVIDKTKSAGGNAIRFDEMDVCEGNSSCQAGLNKSLGKISQYARQQGMALVGADNAPSVTALLQAQNNGGAPVIAALVDASAKDNAGNLKDMQSVVGNLPIINVNTG